MASPLTVTRNDYHKNRKSSTIYTPVGVAQFLFDILQGAHPLKRRGGPCGGGGRCRADFHTVLDPAIGSGRLTDPWFDAGRRVIGCDLLGGPPVKKVHRLIRGKFEYRTWPAWEECSQPDLVLCNPPFNSAPGRQLYPEVFLKHIFDLFGPQMPTVMFTPMGLLKNQRKKSTRWHWLRDCGAQITSIVSMPLDIFPGVEFHSEIIIFNVNGLKAHYFLPEEALA